MQFSVTGPDGVTPVYIMEMPNDLSSKQMDQAALIWCKQQGIGPSGGVTWRGMDWSGMRLDLVWTSMSGTRLRGCDLSGASVLLLEQSSAIECNFYKAQMLKSIRRSGFDDCNFVSADFSNINGERAVFTNCDFTGASFKGAQLAQVHFSRGCKGMTYDMFENAKLTDCNLGRKANWPEDTPWEKFNARGAYTED